MACKKGHRTRNHTRGEQQGNTVKQTEGSPAADPTQRPKGRGSSGVQFPGKTHCPFEALPTEPLLGPSNLPGRECFSCKIKGYSWGWGKLSPPRSCSKKMAYVQKPLFQNMERHTCCGGGGHGDGSGYGGGNTWVGEEHGIGGVPPWPHRAEHHRGLSPRRERLWGWRTGGGDMRLEWLPNFAQYTRHIQKAAEYVIHMRRLRNVGEKHTKYVKHPHNT